MYVLQKNNCYPFKSHFLIGLAVVEGKLVEETSERQAGRMEEEELEEEMESTTSFICCPIIELHRVRTAPTSRSIRARHLFLYLINRKVTITVSSA